MEADDELTNKYYKEHVREISFQLALEVTNLRAENKRLLEALNVKHSVNVDLTIQIEGLKAELSRLRDYVDESKAGL